MTLSIFTVFKSSYSISKHSSCTTSVCSTLGSILTICRATVAILYRPYVLNAAGQPITGASRQWYRNAVRRGRDAASNTNNLLERLIELDGIKYLKPMMYARHKPFRIDHFTDIFRITAVVPATQIHLADCKSDNALTRGLGQNKLQLCMLVFADLRSTYWSADVMYRLFQRAQTLMKERERQSTSYEARPATPDGELSQVAEQLLSESQQAAGPMHESVALPVDPLVPFFADSSPQFSDVDQLLSPGFALSEEVFLYFFPNYLAGNYGQPLVPNYY